jgi:hypothetical protein
MKIRCTTTFDITATGVTGHYKPSRVPFTDRTGHVIANERDWNLARNQQRNWETLTQLISLRTQVDNIFDFEIESDTVFLLGTDPLGILKNDCQGVPMLLGPDSVINTANVQFDLINIS